MVEVDRYYTALQVQGIMINESVLRDKITKNKDPSGPPVSLHLSILYAPTISNKSIISLNWTHFIGHPSKYQFKLNKIRKGGGSSLLDGILYTNRGVIAALKWINELTQRGWSKWPWVNTPAAERETNLTEYRGAVDPVIDNIVMHTVFTSKTILVIKATLKQLIMTNIYEVLSVTVLTTTGALMIYVPMLSNWQGADGKKCLE